jgi:hypothetical protein
VIECPHGVQNCSICDKHIKRFRAAAPLPVYSSGLCGPLFERGNTNAD